MPQPCWQKSILLMLRKVQQILAVGTVRGFYSPPKNPAEVHPKWDRRHCGSGRSLACRQFALWLGWPPRNAQPRRFEGDLGFTRGCAWLQGIRHQTPQVVPAPGSLQRCCDTSREVLGWLGTVCNGMGWSGHTLCLPSMTGEVLMVPRASLGSVGVWPARSCLPEQSRAEASPAGRRQSARVIATGGDKPWPEPAVSGRFDAQRWARDCRRVSWEPSGVEPAGSKGRSLQHSAGKAALCSLPWGGQCRGLTLLRDAGKHPPSPRREGLACFFGTPSKCRPSFWRPPGNAGGWQLPVGVGGGHDGAFPKISGLPTSKELRNSESRPQAAWASG